MSVPADWPNRASSRQVRAGGFSWHVQVMGEGPTLLLLHGTGAATHSWRDLAPLLAAQFHVVAPDLPGHGFTEAPADRRMSMPGMAKSVQSLLAALDATPALIAGHSAGAAIAIRMALDGMARPHGLVGLNAALLPMTGVPGQLFAPLAKLFAGLPFLPHLFALQARDPARVKRLLDGTGSQIDPAGAALYARLLRDPKHDAAALAMMGKWDLAGLRASLPQLRTPLLLIAGSGDGTVPPGQSAEVAAMIPGAEVVTLDRLGHLAHEEAPARTAALIEEFARRVGALG